MLAHFLFLALFANGAHAFQGHYQDYNLQQLQQVLHSQDFAKRLSAQAQVTSCTAGDPTCLTWSELFVTALDEVAADRSNGFLLQRLQWVLDLGENNAFDLEDQIILLLNFRKRLPHLWRTHEKNLARALVKQPQISNRLLYTLYHHRRNLGSQWTPFLKEAEKRHPWLRNMTTMASGNRYAAARDLLRQNPPIEKYQAGAYADGIRVYMFCREDRSYPCLMVLRESDGSLHLDANGNIWSQPSLGFSRHLKNYDEVNGNTPSGVFMIDGVMPVADNPKAYGKFRRMILNMAPPSKGESQQKLLLPASSHAMTWWREAVVARDIGRGLFRIHGTGTKSPRDTNYFPFYGTSGCVAKRENTYDGVTYKDQRLFLDELMLGLGLAPIYNNEPQIHGLLYVMNIDDVTAPVHLEDLDAAGILP